MKLEMMFKEKDKTITEQAAEVNRLNEYVQDLEAQIKKSADLIEMEITKSNQESERKDALIAQLKNKMKRQSFVESDPKKQSSKAMAGMFVSSGKQSARSDSVNIGGETQNKLAPASSPRSENPD